MYEPLSLYELTAQCPVPYAAYLIDTEELTYSVNCSNYSSASPV